MVALILHISFHRPLSKSGGGNIVAGIPEASLRNLFGFLLDPSAGLALDDGDGIGDRVFGRYGEIQVDMVVTDVPGVDFKAFPICDGLEYSFEFGFNIVVCQYLFPVTGSEDQMVLAGVCAMAQLIQASIGHN